MRSRTLGDHGSNAQPYFSHNKTMRELHDLMKSRAGIDPLKDFSEAACEELRAFPPQ